MHTARHRHPDRGWSRARTELVRLLLPVDCAGCGHRDTDLCRDCLRLLTRAARPVRDVVGGEPVRWSPLGLPLFAVTTFGPVTSSVLTAWKDGGRADLTAVVAAGLARSLTAAAAGRTAASGGGRPSVDGLVDGSVDGSADGSVDGSVDGWVDSPLLAVAVPSAPRAVRRRGADLVPGATALAVRRTPGTGVWSPVVGAPVLVHGGRSRDQAGLGAEQRAANVAGRLRCRRMLRGRGVVLVDDVVTTGATLAEAARAVRAAGGHVVGAAVVAATPRRHVDP